MKRMSYVFATCLMFTLCVVAQAAPAADDPDSADDDQDPWKGLTDIAIVSSNDRITQIHVNNLLKSRGIECYMVGSIVYGVKVPTKDADRSIAVLKKDLAKRRYWITLYEGEKEQHFEIPKKLWNSKLLNKKYEDLIRLEEYGESTDLGAVLRHPDVKEAAKTYFYVTEIKLLAREYLDGNGKIQTGYEVNLNLAASPDSKTGEWGRYLQVWDRGKAIIMGGGYGIAPATEDANEQQQEKDKDAPKEQ